MAARSTSAPTPAAPPPANSVRAQEGELAVLPVKVSGFLPACVWPSRCLRTTGYLYI